MKKLKECPLCGWKSTILITQTEPGIFGERKLYKYSCYHCGMTAQPSRILSRARHKWNRLKRRGKKNGRKHIYGREF